MGVEAPQEDDVGPGVVGEEGPGLAVELGHHLGRVVGDGHVGQGGGGRHAHLLGVGVGQQGAEALAPEHDQHPVLGLVGEGDLDAGDGDAGPEALDHLRRLVVGQAAGPAVGDAALGVERGQVAAGGHVARPDLDLEAGGRQGAPARAGTRPGRSRTGPCGPGPIRG